MSLSLASEIPENFIRDLKGRRKSQRRSSILKGSRAFDEIQNTSHDDRFKDRRVSFSNNIEVKYIKEFGKITDRKISTPKCQDNKSISSAYEIDRLSIIPKFEKSFVEDSEDFEPYDDENYLTASGGAVEVNKDKPNIELHKKVVSEWKVPPPTSPASPPVIGSVTNSPQGIPRVPPETEFPSPQTCQPVTCSVDNPQTATSEPVQLEPDSSNTCDMELTAPCPGQNLDLSARAFLVVPEISAMGNDGPAPAGNDRDSGVGSVENEGISKRGSPDATINETMPMSFTMAVDIQSDTINKTEDMEIDVESFSVEEKREIIAHLVSKIAVEEQDNDDTIINKDGEEINTVPPVNEERRVNDAVPPINEERGTLPPINEGVLGTGLEKVDRQRMTSALDPVSLPGDVSSQPASNSEALPMMEVNSTSKANHTLLIEGQKIASKPPLHTTTNPSSRRKNETFSVIQSSLKRKKRKSPMPVHVPRTIGTKTVAVSTPLNSRASYVSRHTPTFSGGRAGISFEKPTNNNSVVSSLGRSNPLPHDNYQQQCDDMEIAHSCLGEDSIHTHPLGAPSSPNNRLGVDPRDEIGSVSSLTSGPSAQHQSEVDGFAGMDSKNRRSKSSYGGGGGGGGGPSVSEKNGSQKSSDFETVSSLSDLGNTNSTVSPPTTSTTTEGNMTSIAPAFIISSNRTTPTGGNWLEDQDSSFNLIESSGEFQANSEEFSETTATKTAVSLVKEEQRCPTPPASVKRRKSPFKRKKRKTPKTQILRPHLLQGINNNIVDIETPETVQIECRDEATTQASLFDTPELTIIDEAPLRRQSLMMSPSAFTKFLTTLNCDKTLGDQTINQELLSCPGACVEVSTAGEEEDALKGNDDPMELTSGGNLSEATDKSVVAQLADRDSPTTESVSHHSENHDSSCDEMEVSRFDTPPPPADTHSFSRPLTSESNFLPLSSHSSPHPPPQLPETRSSLPPSEILSSPLHSPSSPPHSEPSTHASDTLLSPPHPPDMNSTDEDSSLSSKAEEVGNNFLTRDVGGNSFIMHIHLLRARFLSISRSSQTRLGNSSYMNRNSHSLFRPLLESIITRANIGISVLTLLINYGDISGLAKPKERIPTLSDISVSETLKREKYEWMKCMHDDICRKWSDIEAAMVSAAEIYHWQVDCWNRSKIAITIHNSAKITFTLEDGPVCMYPQRIAKTKVQYVRGSLLFSKPQTKACTTTADIVQLLWTIIRHRGNS